MKREIRLYVEGGGDGSNTKSLFRRAFGEALQSLRELAQAKKLGWAIIACGGREATFDAFRTALKAHSDAFNVLLVDSETAVELPPWQHLQKVDGWAKPDEVDDRHCHFMAQAMEAWLIADRNALAKFYGKGFKHNALPRQQDVEQIPKTTASGISKPCGSRDKQAGIPQDSARVQNSGVPRS